MHFATVFTIWLDAKYFFIQVLTVCNESLIKSNPILSIQIKN